MSTTKRIVSGSAASWARIAITILSQVILVPLYLSHWDVVTFGVWLAIQALVALLTTLDFGFQTYLEFEFLKIGSQHPKTVGRYLSSGIMVGVILSIVQVLIIVGLTATAFFTKLIDVPANADPGIIHQATVVLLLQGLTWLITTSPSGLMGRALAPFGYFPRSAWWQVAIALVFSVSTAIAVIMGASLMQTGIVGAIASLIFSFFFYTDFIRLLKRAQIPFIRPSRSLARETFVKSILLSGKIVLDIVRQQGVRLFLAPLAGIVALAAFSTTRTASNFAMQGLNTLTNPLMPELMRFLHSKDQTRFESAIGTIWIVVVAVIAPMMLVLQVFIGPIFEVWTHGKIQVQPLLFATLSVSVLVYAWAQPAIAIVRGNNLLRPQLYISVVTTVVVIGLIILLVSMYGITGAGFALLVPEIISAIWYRSIAKSWLEQNHLNWPATLSRITLLSIVITTIGVTLMIIFPHYRFAILGASLLALVWNIFNYWKHLPEFATQSVSKILYRFPIVKRFKVKSA